MPLRNLLIGLAALALCVPAAAQTVHVVDANGTGDYLQPQDAVDAAVDGDVILILGQNAPTYDAIVISGKGLTIAGAGTRPRIETVSIVQTPPGSTTTLRSLVIVPPFTLLAGTALGIGSSDGSVFIEDTDVSGGPAGFESDAQPAVTIWSSSSDVVGNRWEVRGGGGWASPAPFTLPADGGIGIERLAAGGSATQFEGGAGLALWDSEILGGQGDFGFYGGNALGERGLSISSNNGSSELFLAGSTVAAGDNGAACCTSRPGIDASGRDVGIASVASPITAGAGSNPVDPVVLSNGAEFDELPGAGRSFTVESPVFEQDPAAVTYEGEPGDMVFALRSTRLGWRFFPDLRGVFHLGAPFAGPTLLGVADGAGLLELSITAPNLPVGQDAAQLFVQPYAVTTGGLPRLGPPSVAIIVDAEL